MYQSEDKRDQLLNFAPGYKIWLDKDGGAQGEGFFKLLEYIDQTGSITGAATALGMSYRAAWGKVKTAEKKWGITLVITRVGGQTGGGTKLTPEAIDLMHRFRSFQRDLEKQIQDIFNKNFLN